MSHHHHKRALRWLQKPTKTLKARFSRDGVLGWYRIEVLRPVTPEMRPWVSDERIQTELLNLAKRNLWIP